MDFISPSRFVEMWPQKCYQFAICTNATARPESAARMATDLLGEVSRLYNHLRPTLRQPGFADTFVRRDDVLVHMAGRTFSSAHVATVDFVNEFLWAVFEVNGLGWVASEMLGECPNVDGMFGTSGDDPWFLLRLYQEPANETWIKWFGDHHHTWLSAMIQQERRWAEECRPAMPNARSEFSLGDLPPNRTDYCGYDGEPLTNARCDDVYDLKPNRLSEARAAGHLRFITVDRRIWNHYGDVLKLVAARERRNGHD